MHVSCQRCGHEVNLANLAEVEGGFGFECAICDHVNVLAPIVAPIVAPLDPAAEVPDDVIVCPKCRHQQRDEHACHRCGLVFGKIATGEAQIATDPLGENPRAAELRSRWDEIRHRLDDEPAHADFIETCRQAGALEFAGFCYRTLSVHGEAPRAAIYRERVLRSALAEVTRLATPRPSREAERTRVLLLAAFGAALLLAAAICLYLVTRVGAGRPW